MNKTDIKVGSFITDHAGYLLAILDRSDTTFKLLHLYNPFTNQNDYTICTYKFCEVNFSDVNSNIKQFYTFYNIFDKKTISKCKKLLNNYNKITIFSS